MEQRRFRCVTTEIATGARGRTRKAILDAAIGVLATDPAASLGQIADAADVGRTTLHRYFPERADLLTALTRKKPPCGSPTRPSGPGWTRGPASPASCCGRARNACGSGTC